MTPNKLPYLHKNARSRQPQAHTGEEIDEGPITRYAYDQGHGGAAWHAVLLSRADKEKALAGA